MVNVQHFSGEMQFILAIFYNASLPMHFLLNKPIYMHVIIRITSIKYNAF